MICKNCGTEFNDNEKCPNCLGNDYTPVVELKSKDDAYGIQKSPIWVTIPKYVLMAFALFNLVYGYFFLLCSTSCADWVSSVRDVADFDLIYGLVMICLGIYNIVASSSFGNTKKKGPMHLCLCCGLQVLFGLIYFILHFMSEPAFFTRIFSSYITMIFFFIYVISLAAYLIMLVGGIILSRLNKDLFRESIQ